MFCTEGFLFKYLVAKVLCWQNNGVDYSCFSMKLKTIRTVILSSIKINNSILISQYDCFLFFTKVYINIHYS